MSIEPKERQLAHAIVSTVLKKLGKSAGWSAVKLQVFAYAQKIHDKYGVDVSTYIAEIIEEYPRNKKGQIYLPDRLSHFPSPEKIASEISSGFQKAVGPPEEVVEALSQYQSLTTKMLGAEEYLERWNSDPKEVIKNLSLMSRKRLVSRPSIPADFEFTVAKSLCILFQVPLYVEYSASLVPHAEECVVWRGKVKNNIPTHHAPGGGADILLCARGPYYLTVEATLRFSPRQWKEEIEPIFRHTKEFIEKNSLNNEDVYLLFVVGRELLEETYEWLNARSEDFNIVALNAETLLKLAKASLLTFSLTHAEVRRLLITLSRRLTRDSEVKVYITDMKRTVDDWIRSLLEPNFEVFLAVSAYEYLTKKDGVSKIDSISKSIAEKEEVTDYLNLLGRKKEDIKRKTREWVHQLSILGLAREIDGYLKALPVEEFEAKMLKTYKHVLKITSL